MKEIIQVFKSQYKWNKKHPWICSKGDLTASFKTKRQAVKFKPIMKRAIRQNPDKSKRYFITSVLGEK